MQYNLSKLKMKTSFIQVDNADNLDSIRDKIRWIRTNRVLLMLPEKGLVIDKLELQLLKRYCLALGARVAILSRDDDVHLIAVELGIPVFTSLRSAQLHSWNRRSRSILG